LIQKSALINITGNVCLFEYFTGKYRKPPSEYN